MAEHRAPTNRGPAQVALITTVALTFVAAAGVLLAYLCG